MNDTRKTFCLFLLAALTAASVVPARSQRRTGPPREPKLEELPRRPVDTIATSDPETRVIIYSNNTWEYYRPTLERQWGELPVYRNNWDTASVFSYRSIELGDLPAVIELKLIDSLDQFCCPVQGKVLSKYGPRRRRSHNGVDIPLKTGEPVRTAFDGKVRYARYNTGGFGYLVIVRHANGLETWHAHLSKLNVEVGDYVKTGQVIGYIGSTGRAYGPHLHFEVRYCDQAFDPEFLFDFEKGMLRYQIFALEHSYFNIQSRASELLEEDDPEQDIANMLLAGADDSTAIRAAQPKSAAASGGPVYHIVKKGDILGRIAPRYGTTIARICQLNGIDRNSTLRLGQRLRVK
ncbi:peptidoglycan DD-metalloendopeptidase family protein [uncultured Rikenella sp.]|uniref:peptidoglycan DD-metalloendopeptidase family protein n=1 Tax=uncultured Rikenella sp. TaxID=368003 RepID=UPI002609E7FA|nr:peptidoglycan DD-metalloendopeptidase family protein [uncultured Rikenella sp.]